MDSAEQSLIYDWSVQWSRGRLIKEAGKEAATRLANLAVQPADDAKESTKKTDKN